jgi:ribose transport system permease protein
MKNTIVSQVKDKAIWIVFIILFIAFAFANKRFVSPSNLFTIARQVSMYGIAAVGMTFVILIGGIDLAAGSIITVVNVVCAYLMVEMQFSMVAAVLTSLILAAAIGALNGFLVAKIAMPAIIATFATQIIFEGAAYLLSGGTPVYGFDERFKIYWSGLCRPCACSCYHYGLMLRAWCVYSQ